MIFFQLYSHFTNAYADLITIKSVNVQSHILKFITVVFQTFLTIILYFARFSAAILHTHQTAMGTGFLNAETDQRLNDDVTSCTYV